MLKERLREALGTLSRSLRYSRVRFLGLEFSSSIVYLPFSCDEFGALMGKLKIVAP